MQKKDQVKIVEGMQEIHSNMNALSVDMINETPTVVVEKDPETKISMKELAKLEGYEWIEPRRSLPAMGTLPPSQKREHDHDWEYVRGIYENFVVAGEGIEFWLSKYPGDRDCMWYIPANKPVCVPRMVAKHLESHLRYHKFTYRSDLVTMSDASSINQKFGAFETHYRGKFRPIGAFA